LSIKKYWLEAGAKIARNQPKHQGICETLALNSTITRGGFDFEQAFRATCAGLFALPALIALVSQGWRGEAGSLSPIVLLLGGWTVWQTADVLSKRNETTPGSTAIWLVIMLPVVGAYVFAQAVEMVFMMALSAWVGLVLTFYAWFGALALRKCTLPITLTALAVPLPYTLSLAANNSLRDFTSYWAVQASSLLNLDVAQGAGVIIIGPYVMMVENACAGATSMLSLIAIGILYAYWMRCSGPGQTIGILLAAVPIAFAANILRVVFLLILVHLFDVSVLNTFFHPLSGLISFVFSMGLLLTWSKLLYLVNGRKERAA